MASAESASAKKPPLREPGKFKQSDGSEIGYILDVVSLIFVDNHCTKTLNSFSFAELYSLKRFVENKMPAAS